MDFEMKSRLVLIAVTLVFIGLITALEAMPDWQPTREPAYSARVGNYDVWCDLPNRDNCKWEYRP